MEFKLNKNNLNFNVFTSPSVPDTGNENDIVIFSDVEMTNWVLSPDTPRYAPANVGDVWIQYQLSGNTFNALKDGSFLVSIYCVYQYLEGTWQEKKAMVYRSGEWTETIVYLFGNGSLHTDVTGGWSKAGENDFTVSPYIGNSTGSQSIDGELLQITWTSKSSSYNSAAFYATNNKINLKPFSSITVEVVAASGYLTRSRIGVMRDKCPWTSDDTLWSACAEAKQLEKGTVTLDVSKLTGDYHIVIGGQSSGTGTGNTGTIIVNEIVMR